MNCVEVFFKSYRNMARSLCHASYELRVANHQVTSIQNYASKVKHLLRYLLYQEFPNEL